jgi:hypothetical protein
LLLLLACASLYALTYLQYPCLPSPACPLLATCKAWHIANEQQIGSARLTCFAHTYATHSCDAHRRRRAVGRRGPEHVAGNPT